MSLLDEARREYAHAASRLLRGVAAHGRPNVFQFSVADCPGCEDRAREAEAASVALDMVTAWTISGPRPRGQVARGIPLA